MAFERECRICELMLSYAVRQLAEIPDAQLHEIHVRSLQRGVHGAEKAARAERLLAFAGLSAFTRRQARNLSGGMKQKLALAATLIHEPDIIYLDEPTTGVDPVSRRDFWKLLARLQRDGLTILLTTPYLDEAERCTRVALIDHGRLLTVDTPDALRAGEPGLLVELVAEPRQQALAALREKYAPSPARKHGNIPL